MDSKSCQTAACLIPKFKLNWTNSENRHEIKQTFLECITENELTETNPAITIITAQSSGSDSEGDFFKLNNYETNVETNDIQIIANNYFSNTNIKTPLDLPLVLKNAYIQYNTAIPSSAHVERLYSAGGQLFNKRRGSMADNNFEMTLLLKFDNYMLLLKMLVCKERIA
eukprot:XP_016656482.1 PREDICTED: uncharacterized protein LOC107882538 [Acyrthosiphon pisum]